MAMIIGIIAVFVVLWGIDRMLTKKTPPETAPKLPAQIDSSDAPAILTVPQTQKVPQAHHLLPAAADDDDDAQLAAAIAAALACYGHQSDHIVAVIAAALACYGYRPNQIISVRPVGGTDWAKLSRIEAVSVRNQMF